MNEAVKVFETYFEEFERLKWKIKHGITEHYNESTRVDFATNNVIKDYYYYYSASDGSRQVLEDKPNKILITDFGGPHEEIYICWYEGGWHQEPECLYEEDEQWLDRDVLLGPALICLQTTGDSYENYRFDKDVTLANNSYIAQRSIRTVDTNFSDFFNVSD
jgi:hypothetical protein